MSWYGDLSANLLVPTNDVDHAAHAALECLEQTPGIPVLASDLDAYIESTGVALGANRRCQAIRALKNAGYPIISCRGRSSWYMLGPAINERLESGIRTQHELYTMLSGLSRSLNGDIARNPRNRDLRQLLSFINGMAVMLGPSVGLTAAEIMTDLLPIP